MRQDILTGEVLSGLSVWPLKAELSYTLSKMTLGSALMGLKAGRLVFLTGEQGGLLGRGGPVPGQEWEGPGHSGVG